MKNNILWIFIHLHKTGGTTFNVHLAKYFELNKNFFHLDSKEDQINFNKLSKEKKEKVKVISGHELYYGIHNHFPSKKARYIIFIRDPAERLVSQYNHHVAQISGPKPSFEKWYKNYPKNEMTLFLNKRYNSLKKRIQRSTLVQRFLGKLTNSKLWKIIRYPLKSRLSPTNLREAEELLEKCWFVGITERLNDDLKFLCKKMHIPQKWKNFRVTGKSKTWKNILGSDAKISYPKIKLTDNLRKKIYKENLLDLQLYKYAKKLNQLKHK